MRQFATGDCETDPFKAGRVPRPFIWGFYDGETYQETASIVSYIEILANYKGPVYFHNGGKFDFHFLLPYINQETNLSVINGRVAEFKIGDAILRDSYCLLPTALSAFCKQEFDYTKLEADKRGQFMAEISEYLKSDCVNLHNYLREFFTRYPAKLTLAGTALKVWRDMKGRVDQTNESFYTQFAPYYYGGRCEVFHGGIHEKPVNVYDIKSAYPFAMTHEHPAGREFFARSKITHKHLYKSFVHITAESAGALPLREPDNGISFPHGEHEFFCTGHELLTGLETETVKVKKVHHCYTFLETINFRKYVDHFYREKSRCERDGDIPGRLFAKLFLNSLYGKMAANPMKYREYKIGPFGTRPPDGYDLDVLLYDMQLFSRPLDESRWFFYNIATAASITGFVRAYLWKNICRSKGVLYCDTDSIFCDHAKVDIGDKLGQWEVEFTGSLTAIAGKKLYAIFGPNGKTKIASKGVRLTAAEIKRIATGAVIKYNPTVPTFSIKNGVDFVGRSIRATY